MTIFASPGLAAYCVFLAALLGAVMGSFLNCVAMRFVRSESFLRGRSHCRDCGHVLSAPDLVPVFSWVFLKGRCRHCGAKISARYPLTELAFALLSVLCLLRFDVSWLCLRNWLFLCCLFCLTLTDGDDYVIPDGCLILAAGVWLVFVPLLGLTLRQALLSVGAGLLYGGVLLALSLVMDKVLGKESLGGGDVKLFAVMGLYLGFVGGLFALILSCVLGLLSAVLLRRGMGNRLPFGPAIAAATALMLLYGAPLVDAYLSLL